MRFRFSVRGLLALVLIIAAGMGWIVRQAHVQRDAVAAIEKAGEVRYACDANMSSPGNTLPGWKEGIAEYIGIDFVDHVVSVRLKSHGTRADLQQAVDRLGDLVQVRRMNLMGIAVKDDALVQVERMSRLESLLLQFTSISDGGLAHMRNLTNIKTLLIAGGISDAGLVHLKELTKLSDLTLQRTQISDAGLAHLSGLASLSELSLSDNKLSDAGLVHLKGLTNLSRLDLRRTQVSDAGLVHLKGLGQLSRLNLSYTQVSDAGLVHLKGLTKLSRLDVDYSTRVTDEGIKTLKQALPGLTINRSY